MAANAVPDHVDVIVVGSGAGGLSAAVVARHAGLDVLVLEKESLYGGTTARSGGVLWVPGHGKNPASAPADSFDDALTYMRHEAGAQFDEDRVRAFLENGPAMVRFFESETSVAFLPVPEFSDYHPGAPGARSGGRSLVAAPYDAGALGDEVRRLRPPLREITFVGMMFNASQEVAHFFNCTRSLRSAAYVTKRLFQHALEMLRHGRAQRLTNGNALVARLARSAFDLGVTVRTEAPVQSLVFEEGRVTGVRARIGGELRTVRARRGVVLASGGFPQDPVLRARLFSHAPTGSEHWSPAPPGNTGDGWRLAESVGGLTSSALPNAAAWIPVSRVPRGGDRFGVFPHLIDRYKPGIIAVTRDGQRFVNEAHSYHDFGQALRAKCAQGEDTCAWLIADHRAMRRYGLGFAKPFPVPLLPHLWSGYLLRGRTPAELAQRAGIDAQVFERTVANFNADAVHGRDPAFGKGDTAYNRYLGDASHQPNPCVAPLDKGPYYAVKLVMGDLGTFAGVRTDASARVLGASGGPIAGLYAVGNDALSVMGGNYPGGGITLGPAMTFGYIAARHLAQPQATKARPASGPRAAPLAAA
ncbi:FAD-dependent oxidoreductase [Hydrogenophaga sp.]|uniref:FAD-dependent oxidoreductase n=1 Tax=Hydrogenophaga sp. TaxID=1904254 RepID=UPI00261D186C|nr:FAD-dependent oxidoreductase [Hydrogenophaga sp.]